MNPDDFNDLRNYEDAQTEPNLLYEIPPEIFMIILKMSGNVLNLICCSKKIYNTFTRLFHKPDANLNNSDELRGYLRCVKHVLSPKLLTYYTGYFVLVSNPGVNNSILEVPDATIPIKHYTHITPKLLKKFVMCIAYLRDVTIPTKNCQAHQFIKKICNTGDRGLLEYLVMNLPGRSSKYSIGSCGHPSPPRNDNECEAPDLYRRTEFMWVLSPVTPGYRARLWKLYRATRFAAPRFSERQRRTLADAWHVSLYNFCEEEIAMMGETDELIKSGGDFAGASGVNRGDHIKKIILRYFIVNVVYHRKLATFRSFLDYYHTHGVNSCIFVGSAIGTKYIMHIRKPQSIVLELIRMKSKYSLEFLDILYAHPMMPQPECGLERHPQPDEPDVNAETIYRAVNYTDSRICDFIFQRIVCNRAICLEIIRGQVLCGEAIQFLKPEISDNAFDVISSYERALKKNDLLAVQLLSPVICAKPDVKFSVEINEFLIL